MIIIKQEFKEKFYIKDKTLATLTDEKLNNVRGEEIGMIFQDPLSALNPLMRIGEQIEEGLDLSYENFKTRAKYNEY